MTVRFLDDDASAVVGAGAKRPLVSLRRIPFHVSRSGDPSPSRSPIASAAPKFEGMGASSSLNTGAWEAPSETARFRTSAIGMLLMRPRASVASLVPGCEGRSPPLQEDDPPT